MNYSVNTYFTPEECSEIVQYCMENGEIFFYDPNENWDCRRIYTDTFKEKILLKFKELHNSEQSQYWFNYDNLNIKDVNVSLTRYYDGRFLNLHKDTSSQFTTVIVLSNNFKDGRFVLSDVPGKGITDMGETSIKLEIGIGEGISFEGSKTYHGVMPVYEGIRCALNVWMTNEDTGFYKLKNNKTLL